MIHSNVEPPYNPSRRIPVGHKLIPNRCQVALDNKLSIACQFWLRSDVIWQQLGVTTVSINEVRLAIESSKIILNGNGKTRIKVLNAINYGAILNAYFYKVQIALFLRSTDWNTGYGDFFQNGVRRVHVTNSSKLAGYELKHGEWIFISLIWKVGT